ncbi:MAG: hypothetical protein R3F11_31460, partial [Verrucomicrobiales bacterium]
AESDFDFEFEILAARYFDGTAGRAEIDQLSALLRESPERRAAFLELGTLDQALREEFAAPRRVASAAPHRAPAFTIAAAAAAAAALVALAGAAWLLWFSGQSGSLDEPGAVAHGDAASPPPLSESAFLFPFDGFPVFAASPEPGGEFDLADPRAVWVASLISAEEAEPLSLAISLPPPPEFFDSNDPIEPDLL